MTSEAITSSDLKLASPAQIETYQMTRLRTLVEFLQKDSQNDFYKAKLAHIASASLNSYSNLRELPFTLKSELVAEQSNHPPYGRNLSYPETEYVKLHQTSGTTGRPLRVLDTRQSWEWWGRCWVEVFKAAGVTADDRIFFGFSFGPFIGFWAAYEGAAQLGALAIPGGGMDTDQRLAAIFEQGATAICCTPSYALYLAEAAAQRGIDLTASPVRVLIHAGEPGASIPAVRQRIEQAWGAKVYDHAGASEIGAYGFSTSAQNGLYVNEAEFIVEVLEPGTNIPVAPGESGEMVLTNLGRWGYPVIRYRTSDVVKLSGATAESNSKGYKLLEGGIIGRTDDMITVRGVNIYPSSVEAIIREVVPATEFRMIFFRQQNMDELEIEIELEAHQEALHLERLEISFRQRLALRVPLRVVPPNSLPRFQLKARRIEDRRNLQS